PIPGAAGVIAAIVHFFASPNFAFNTVNTSGWFAVIWLAIVLGLGWLMVSTWRFYSFKEIDLGRRHPYVFMVALAALMAGLWYYSEVVLMVVVAVYLGSALAWRMTYAWHRLRRA